MENTKTRLANLVKQNCPDWIGLVDSYVSEILTSFGQKGFEDFTDDELLDDFITYAETINPPLHEECCSAEFQRLAPAKVKKIVAFASDKKKALGKKDKYNQLGEHRTRKLREDSLDDFDIDGSIAKSNAKAMQNEELQDAIRAYKEDCYAAIKNCVERSLEIDYGLTVAKGTYIKNGEYKITCANNIFGGSVNIGSSFYINIRLGYYWDGILPEHKKMERKERFESIQKILKDIERSIESSTDCEYVDARVITSSSGIENCAGMVSVCFNITKEALMGCCGYDANLNESISKQPLDEEKLEEGKRLKAFILGTIMAVMGASSLHAKALTEPADWEKTAAKAKQELTAEYGKGGTIPKADFEKMCKALKTNDSEAVKKEFAKGGSPIGKRWFMSMDDCKDNVAFILDDLGFEVEE